LGKASTTWTARILAPLAGNPRIQVIAGSSRDEGRRRRFEERSGVKTYAAWRDMLEREALDLISVATYAPAHAEIVVACAARGIKVIYCEKPLRCTWTRRRSMWPACRQAGDTAVINPNRRSIQITPASRSRSP